MVRQKTLSKKSIRYRQFQGGYAKVPAGELRALMEGYRRRLFRRNEIRVFAARWEAAALHCESRVSLYRIVNCDSKKAGVRRLSETQINTASAKLDDWLPVLVEGIADGSIKRTKPVARRALRHIARGGSTSVEGLFLLAYFMRRIPQSKPMQRLRDSEHYARFRYAEFESWTGVSRATQSRMLPRLMHRGYLNTIEVHQQNQNAYGQLFVDGPMLSLVRSHQSPRRPMRQANRQASNERSSPAARNVNAGGHERSTARKSNPKREIREGKGPIEEGANTWLATHRDADLRRIALRAAQMEGQRMNQAA